MSGSLPKDAEARNRFPMADGLLYYFPAALAAVAEVSRIGNEQHNPGEPMHWARGKSMDHANKILRHQVDAGLMDSDGQRHSAKVAWRALAQLQEELEREEGAPLPRNARPWTEAQKAAHASAVCEINAEAARISAAKSRAGISALRGVPMPKNALPVIPPEALPVVQPDDARPWTEAPSAVDVYGYDPRVLRGVPPGGGIPCSMHGDGS